MIRLRRRACWPCEQRPSCKGRDSAGQWQLVIVLACVTKWLCSKVRRTNTDDTENDNNTSLLRSPVLALGELVDDLVAGHERLDSGHYVGSGEIARGDMLADNSDDRCRVATGAVADRRGHATFLPVRAR
jgi:hypothetical protein